MDLKAEGSCRPHKQIASVCSHTVSRSLIILTLVFSLASCNGAQKQIGIPTEAQTTIDTITGDIAADRVEKIYQEASEEWHRESSLDETKEFFKTLKSKLGAPTSRVFHSAREQQNPASNTPARMLTVLYQTKFERAEGMETFTLVERNGRWLLARYFVTSDALKS